MRKALALMGLMSLGIGGCVVYPRHHEVIVEERPPEHEVIVEEPVDYGPPPPVRVEVLPPRPYYEAIWIRGHWFRDHHRRAWVWTPGYWR